MVELLRNLFFFILAIGILVAVHEWGHFWVARRCGVKVKRFSIGFGKPLWRKVDKLGTEFVIASIPLGGYVKMVDERAEQVAEEDLPFAFNRQHVAKRIAIIAAGPAVNFVFAILAFMLLFMSGITTVKPVIGQIQEQGIFARSAVQPEQQITLVGGAPTPDWESVRLELIRHLGDEFVSVQTQDADGVEFTYQINLSGWQFDPEKDSVFDTLGFRPYLPQIKPELALVEENSPADKAGLKIKDKIVSLNGTPVQEWEQIQSYLADRPIEDVTIGLLRQGQPVSVVATLSSRGEGQDRVGYLGVLPLQEPWPKEYIVTRQFNPLQAIVKGADETWRYVRFTFSSIGKLITGDLSIKNLSGPIAIAQGAGATAQSGFYTYIKFLAIISISLGIMNLLPVPMLDGGHLMFYASEWITGKPVSERIQEIGYRLGASLLLVLMSVALFNDLARL